MLYTSGTIRQVGGGGGCSPLLARYEKREGGGGEVLYTSGTIRQVGGGCSPLQARYEKRAVRFRHDTTSGEGRGGGLLSGRGVSAPGMSAVLGKDRQKNLRWVL